MFRQACVIFNKRRSIITLHRALCDLKACTALLELNGVSSDRALLIRALVEILYVYIKRQRHQRPVVSLSLPAGRLNCSQVTLWTQSPRY